MDASIPESIAVPITPPETVPITSEVTINHFFSKLAIHNIKPAKLPIYIPILPKNKTMLNEKDTGIPL